MVHAVFGVDKWNLLPLDSCLIGGSHPDGVCNTCPHQDYLIVRASESASSSGLQDDGVLCFRKQFDGSVSSGDIVVPSWAVDRLGVMNGHDVLLSHACLKNLEPTEVSRVILIFQGRKSYRHWDEVATSSTITTPGAWYSDWPTGISQKALTKFLPVLINSRKLVDNSLIVLDVLDVTMVISNAKHIIHPLYLLRHSEISLLLVTNIMLFIFVSKKLFLYLLTHTALFVYLIITFEDFQKTNIPMYYNKLNITMHLTDVPSEAEEV